MRIEEDARARKFNIYVDTDSEHRIMKTMMATSSPDIKMMAKLHLNSLYGKVVTDMNKDFIVVHSADNEVGIIFKEKIVGVFKRNDYSADILLGSGYTCTIKEKYEDIIKKLL